MNASQYRAAIDAAVAKGDSLMLDLVAQMCDESEQAKAILRGKGYGVTGTSIVETARQVPESEFCDE